MVSYACSSRRSSALITAAAPPPAATVWLRMGETLEITATRSSGCVSATAMAARRPAPPPPTTSTSQATASMRYQATARVGAYERADRCGRPLEWSVRATNGCPETGTRDIATPAVGRSITGRRNRRAVCASGEALSTPFSRCALLRGMQPILTDLDALDPPEAEQELDLVYGRIG